MVAQIAPGIFWLDSGASNLYLCVEEEGVTLIDAGMPRRERLVWAALAQLARTPPDLKQIIITHADLDHAGSTAALQRDSGATVYASPETAALLPYGRSPKHLPAIAHFFASLMKYTAVPAAAIQTMQDGQTLPFMGGLQVIATPGHTHDHFSLYHPATGVLFAGDALNSRNNTLQITPRAITADIQAARHSALRLLHLNPTLIACGHGRPYKPTKNELKTLAQAFQQG